MIFIRRVGILGGTFSPPHKGHLAMAKASLAALKLDEVIFIPCGYPPHKDIKHVLSSKLRLEMTRLMVKDEPNMSVSDIEIKNEGKSYTAKTLYELNKNNVDTRYFFIVGADSLCYMDEWMTPQIIFDNAEIAVLDRAGYSDSRIEEYIAFLKEKYGAKIHRVYMPEVNVSSSQLREMLLRGEDISEYTGKEIYELISEHINGQRNDY